MAIEYVWDTITGAELTQHIAAGARIVRTAIVKGISTSTVTSRKVAMIELLDASGVFFGDVLDAAYPLYRCVARVLRPIEGTNGTMARAWIHYETTTGSTPIETFAAEDSTSLVAEPTGVFPGTTKQLRCSTTSSSPSYTSDTPPDTDRPIIINFPRVMRTFVLYGLFSDRPSLAVLNAANKVNSATWQGLSKGRWLCTGARARYSNRDGLYAVSVGFLTKGDGVGEDWTTYSVPRKADGTLATVKDATLQALYNAQYSYGIRSDKDGVWAGGAYQLANFGSIFGNTFSLG